MSTFGDRLKHAWNAFTNTDREPFDNPGGWDLGATYGSRPDRVRLRYANEKSIISSIFTRLSIDVAAIRIQHVRLDDQDRYKADVESGLDYCLNVEANLDQAARAFRQDIALTLFDKGTAAIVPIETDLNPDSTGGYDIKTMRVGDIVQWYPKHVKVSVYNEATGRREDITLQKKNVAIIENPLYSVMNQPNSTLQRLIRKLNLLDSVDEASASGNLDIIIQLPYTIKSEARKQQAEQRLNDIEGQLRGSKYGIAYADATEKITQLNRPAENSLMKQVEYLTTMLYGQLGLTEDVMNGTADEKAMLNYIDRTIEPILDAIVEAMIRTFLTKTARSQKQTLLYFRDRSKLVGLTELAEIADKLTRSEAVKSNEIRGWLGLKPDPDPKADELRNTNMPRTPLEPGQYEVPQPKRPRDAVETSKEGDSQNGTGF